MVFMFSLVLQTGCVKKHVNIPLPYTFSQTIPIAAQTDGSFDVVGAIPADVINEEIRNLLSEGMDINSVLIEGLAYTIVETNNPQTVLDATITVAKGQIGLPPTEGPYDLTTVDNKKLGDILGIPQTDALDDQGINLLFQTINSIITGGTAGKDIYFRLNGTLNPVPTGTFVLDIKIDLTISAIAGQCQEVFDLFGSSDPDC